MTSTNITLRIPGDSELVRRLGRHPLLRLGRALVRVLWEGLSGESEEAGTIVGLMLAHLRREAIDEHVAATADEFDEAKARKALDRLSEINAAIRAMPKIARPSGTSFWYHHRYLYSHRHAGLGRPDPFGAGTWLVGLFDTPEDAGKIAVAFGGELLQSPPAWWLESVAKAESQGCKSA